MWGGAVWQHLHADPLVDAIIATCTGICVGRGSVPEWVSCVGKADLAIISNLLFFFLVCFVNTCLAQFCHLCSTSCATMACIFDTTAQAMTSFPRESVLQLV